MRSQILPSVLAADCGRLADEVRRATAAGADALHLDIMDGVFVPNISFGPAVVRMVETTVDAPLSVHLMLKHPDEYIGRFVDAGADSILIHIEADGDIPAALVRIRELGVKTGITVNPHTPAKMIFPVLEIVDEVLCMTVQPGYGGQAFIESVLPKIGEIRDRADAIGRGNLDILVDGGISHETAVACAEHGANVFIAGTFLYRAADMKAEITQMRERTQAALDARCRNG